MDIDLVYLWCDGNDTNFVQQKNEHMLKYGIQSKDAPDCRFVQMDELKYSLRSVAMYMPWIHHIYIVTNNQVPKWLKQHEKVTIVDHSKIMPETARPCFNSQALECCLHQIPDLAEHFIYANDDMFVGRKLSPSFFFDRNQRPIVRLRKNHPYGGQYWNTLLAAQELIKQHYGVSFCGYEPHHNMDSYTKTMLKECEQKFPKLFQHTIHQPFRTESCVQRHLFHLYGIVKKQAILRDVSVTRFHRGLKKLRLARVESLYISNHLNAAPESANHYRAALFCLNDTELSTDEHRARALKFLERKFPRKSPFEKDA